MRWIYFLLIAAGGLLIQNTLAQVIWLPTPFGDVKPMLLVSVAVFVGLFAHSWTDAALAGWALGMATDLTGSGAGMGLLALLYAAAGWAVFQLRTPFFCDRAITQFIMAFLFCAFVYEAWLAYQVLLGGLPQANYGGWALQMLGLSLYTALVTPLLCAGLKRIRRVLFVAPARSERR